MDAHARFNNWSAACEDALNEQIRLEYEASLQYHLMWSYFDQNSVGLKNIAAFFHKNSNEEREHAHAMMTYQNMRGGTVRLRIDAPPSLDYVNEANSADVLVHFVKALQMEQMVYRSLLHLHQVATRENDAQFAGYIESTFLGEQLVALQSLAQQAAHLQRIGNDDGAGILMFDKHCA